MDQEGSCRGRDEYYTVPNTWSVKEEILVFIETEKCEP